ncbi:MAG: hypothetical protein HZC41_05170 [Chloroflexi bacterium]|nr:hypothetical protein [Chloroflexota bacterium]
MLNTFHGTRCLHQQHDNGIHEFVFTESSRQAVDEWFTQLDYITRDVPSGTMMYFLVRSTATDVLPVAYMIKSAFNWVTENPHLYTARVAFLHRSNFYYPHAKSFIRAWQMSNGIAVRFYPSDRRDDAVRWLLAEN